VKCDDVTPCCGLARTKAQRQPCRPRTRRRRRVSQPPAPCVVVISFGHRPPRPYQLHAHAPAHEILIKHSSSCSLDLLNHIVPARALVLLQHPHRDPHHCRSERTHWPVTQRLSRSIPAQRVLSCRWYHCAPRVGGAHVWVWVMGEVWPVCVCVRHELRW
jgi:hypothetical protein